MPVKEVLERASSLLGSSDVIPIVGPLRDQDVIRREDGNVAPLPTNERHRAPNCPDRRYRLSRTVRQHRITWAEAPIRPAVPLPSGPLALPSRPRS
jgi:hypothetical protein